MSKASRKRKKDRRDADKRTRRSANQARYAALRDAGINQKSKRAKMNAKRNKKIRESHLGGGCPNIGCKRCSEVAKQAVFITTSAGKFTRRQHRNQMTFKQFLKSK